jgi:ABC-type multidrug transport system ATPase subunit
MRQRFGIAQALLCDPKLLIVDEPTAGLDPNERNRFYNLLAEVGESTIVILSTHIVQDVKELCSQMAILDNGRVVFSGMPMHAVQELEGRVWERFVEKHEVAVYRDKYRVLSTKLVAGRPLIHVLDDQDPGDGFNSVAPDLEDVYFSMIHSEGATEPSEAVA